MGEGALALMQNELSLRLEGADAIIDQLSKFYPKLQQAAGRKAARKAMAIVRAAARDRVRQLDDSATPQRIWKNVFLQQSRRQSAAVGGVVMRVGILGGARQYANTKENRRKRRVGGEYKTLGDKGNPGGDTWYWRFIELGTERVAARPFLVPALERSAQAVLSTLVDELNIEITRIAAER
jgi:HK97 gp10 family phage protein